MNCFQRLWTWHPFPQSILSTRTGGGKYRSENATTGKTFPSVKALKVEIFLCHPIWWWKNNQVSSWSSGNLGLFEQTFSEPSHDSGKDMCPENLSHKEAEARAQLSFSTMSWLATDLGLEPRVFTSVCPPGFRSSHKCLTSVGRPAELA